MESVLEMIEIFNLGIYSSGALKTSEHSLSFKIFWKFRNTKLYFEIGLDMSLYIFLGKKTAGRGYNH